MAFKTDIEIAQETTMQHITEVAKTAGVDSKYLEQYGNYKAKVDYNILTDLADKPNGKLILVTAINPTPAGEGKTTTTVTPGILCRHTPVRCRWLFQRAPCRLPSWKRSRHMIRRRRWIHILRKRSL